jgi:hypothetical protein
VPVGARQRLVPMPMPMRVPLHRACVGMHMRVVHVVPMPVFGQLVRVFVRMILVRLSQP